jgi:DNA-binding beta-propeller fold protein YncE
MQNSKKLIYRITGGILSFIFFFAMANSAFAYNATNLLGQLDGSNQPVYTTSASNNGAGAANDEGFNFASGVEVDTVNHRLFVSEILNHRVLVFNLDADNNLIDRVADYVLGQPDFVTSSSGTTQAKLAGPRSIAFDSVNNRLFVAEATNNRVVVFDTTTIVNGENASKVLGQPDFTTATTGLTQAKMNFVFGVAYDSANSRLFVGDGGNRRVLVYDVTAITDGENAVNVLGQEDFTTNTAVLDQDGMSGPRGVAYDAGNNRLFVADTTYNRVTVYNVAAITDGEDAVNVLGQPDFTTTSATNSQSTFQSSTFVEYDSNHDRLYIGVGGNRVMIMDVAAITNGEAAVNVLGQPDFTTVSSATTASGMNGAQDMSYDTTNDRLYVGDLSNHRVLIFDFVELPSATLTNATENVAYTETIPVNFEQGTVSLSLTAGALPTGLSLVNDTITGTPTQTGNFNFTLQATDTVSTGDFDSLTRSYALTVSAAASGGSSTHTPQLSSVVDFEINDGAATTANSTVTLTFEYPDNVTGLQIYMLPYSNPASESAVESKTFNICPNSPCVAGNKTIYVKFISSTGQTVVSKTIRYTPEAVALTSPVGSNVVDSSGTIYRIEENGTRSGYTSAGAFLSYKFNSFSAVIPATTADLALPINSKFIAPRNGTLVNDQGTVYIMTDGKRAGFVSEESFLGLGYSFSSVVKGDTSFMETLAPIHTADRHHPDGTLLNYAGTLYVIHRGSLYGFPSMEVLSSWGYSLTEAVMVNNHDKSLPKATLQIRPVGQLSIN